MHEHSIHVTQRVSVAGEALGVLGRASSILSCFDARNRRLTLAQIVRRSGLPKTTAHRLLAEMCQQALLIQDGNEFSIGKRIFELASFSPLSTELREVAVPYMQDLYLATSEVVTLGARDGLEVLYIEKIRGHREITNLSRIGSRMPLYCTGLGKALLAYAPSEVINAAMTNTFVPRTSHTILSATRLERELAEVTNRGTAFDQGEAAIGLTCVAAPILDWDGVAVAALSISIPAGRRRLDQLAPGVRTAAASISRVLRQSNAI